MALKFREKAREKLNAAENFDVPINYTAPHWWLAVCGGLLAVTAFFIWIVWGEIPQTVEGNGVYFQETGEAFCFVHMEERAGIEEQMKVSFQEKGSAESALNGYIEEEKGVLNSQEEMLAYVNGNEALLDYFTEGEPAAVYRCVLEDIAHMKDGAVFQVKIHKENVHPIELWL